MPALAVSVVGVLVAGLVLMGVLVSPTAAAALTIGAVGSAPGAAPIVAPSVMPPPGAAPTVATDPVQVTLSDVSPAVPTAADVLVLTGTATNRSAELLTDLNAYLRMSRVATTARTGIAALVAPGLVGAFRPGPFVPLGDNLAPGASADFRLEVPVADLGLTTAGVYPVGIEVRAGFTDGSRSSAGQSITVIPWQVPVGGFQVPVATVVPISAPVDRAPDGSYLSDDLGALLSRNGRLGALLGIGATGDPLGATTTPPPSDPPVVPGGERFGPAVTWLLDPAVLEAAADMADGYDVRADPDDPTARTPGAHAADADAWLSNVAMLVDRDSVGLLPYGNVDLVALVRAGLAADAVDAIAVAPERAADALAGRVSGQPSDLTVGLLYPPDGVLDDATLQVLAAAGSRTVLLSESGLAAPEAATAATDPVARVVRLDSASPPVTAVAIDAALGDLLADTGSALTARQLALAHTALAALDQAATGAVDPIVVVPLAPPTPDGSAGLDVLAGGAPWVAAVHVTDLLATPSVGATLDYPDSARAAELSPDFVGRVASLQERGRVLTSLDSDAATDLGAARLRAASAGWRTAVDRGNALVDAQLAGIEAGLGQVRIVTTGAVTLSSDRGRFPLTVANDLDVPVTVLLSLTSRTPARLQTSDPELLEIAAGAKTTVDVSAQATTNGTYLVDARLRTVGGSDFGPVRSITLRATQYDTVAWIVMGVAGGSIVLASAVRLVKRARAARAPRRGPA